MSQKPRDPFPWAGKTRHSHLGRHVAESMLKNPPTGRPESSTTTTAEGANLGVPMGLEARGPLARDLCNWDTLWNMTFRVFI